jgi:uncharacterized protein (TIGR04222 family)
MDWLTDNPIADIHGPPFLLIYGAIALAIITAAYGIVRSRDKTGSREPPPVPRTFDPYELAYLRGGKNEVIRTALYALHQLGLIEVIPAKWLTALRLVAGAGVHRARELTAVEECVLRSIDSPVEASHLFQSKRLGSEVDRLCEPFRNKLESEELLRTDSVRQSALLIPFLASAVLVALSLYRILLAVNDRLPSGFLVLLTMISLILVWAVVAPVARARVSDRGRAYLNRLQIAYAQMQRAAPRTEQSPQSDLVSVGLVGLFGLGILSGTPDEAFARPFAKKGSEAVGGYGGATGGCGGGHGHGGGHGCGGGHGGGHGCGGGHGGGCGGGGGGGGGGCGGSSG